MVHVNYLDKDDMQDDTYKLIGTLLADAIISWQTKDILRYHADIDSLYCIVWSRLAPDVQKDFENKLQRASQVVYAQEPDIDMQVREQELTRTFDELRTIFKEITKELDKVGILFKLKTKPDVMITRGGMN